MPADPRLVVLVLHAVATLFMAGVIWIIQLVHYPLFAFGDPTRFAELSTRHQQAISLVVVPAMLVELVGAVLLVLWRPERLPAWTTIVGLALVVAVWLVTFAVQVPQHGRLLEGYDAETIRALVAGNWWRTLLWSARAVLVTWMLLLVASRPT